MNRYLALSIYLMISLLSATFAYAGQSVNDGKAFLFISWFVIFIVMYIVYFICGLKGGKVYSIIEFFALHCQSISPMVYHLVLKGRDSIGVRILALLASGFIFMLISSFFVAFTLTALLN